MKKEKYKIMSRTKEEVELIKELGNEGHHEIMEKISRYFDNLEIVNKNPNSEILLKNIKVKLFFEMDGVDSIMEATTDFEN